MRKRAWLMGLMLMGYILGVSRGYVAIWKDEDPEPWLVTRMPVLLLPWQDVQSLEKGIPVPDDLTLHQLLEDYCS